ncbi:MAG TPA: methyltransferase domain-containing protein [Pyrinomonadaceae bacterium]|nr:methyltransferase domain-containing protein [Pyrinomonadaceae bacterium]
MFSKFRRRSSKLEHLDLGDYTAEEYEGCLAELRRVNRWLGDARALRTTLLRTIGASQLKTFSVIDVGAGSGELLRTIAGWARHHNREAQLTGVELNARSARAIAEQSAMLDINAVRANAFVLPFSDNQFDYAICSLFLHHFKNDQAMKILRELNRVARREVVAIDLHRHPVAYYFYTTIGRLLFHNRLIREDGALSILRGFKPGELNELAEKSGLTHARVVRRFPYRLVLTAKKTEVLPLNQREDDQLMRMAS